MRNDGNVILGLLLESSLYLLVHLLAELYSIVVVMRTARQTPSWGTGTSWPMNDPMES